MTRLLFFTSNLFWLLSSCPALYLSFRNFCKVVTSGANGDRRMTAFVFMNLSSSISLALLTLTLIGWNAFLYGEYSPPWESAMTFQIAILLLFGLGPFLGFSSLFLSLKLSKLFEMAEKSDTDGKRHEEAVKQSDAKKKSGLPSTKVLDFYIEINDGYTNGGYTIEAQGPGRVSVAPISFKYEESPEIFEVIDEIESGYAPDLAGAQQIGEFLFSLLMPSPILAAFERAHVMLEQGELLRVRLNIRPPELARLPWELLYNRYEEVFLATRRTMPLVRFIDSGAIPLKPLDFDGLKTLLVQANPKDLEPLNQQGGERAILQTLGRHSDITILNRPTPVRLREKLQNNTFNFHLLHYDGHSFIEHDDIQNGYLVLEDDEGFSQHLSTAELSNYLDGTSVRLVMLVSCQSSAITQRFIGIAQRLMKSNSNLHAVIAMQFAVTDLAAIAFNEGFYKSLVGGAPIDVAMSAGRLAIIEAVGIDSAEWATPVLFMRTNDGHLFKFKKADAK